MLLSEVLFSGDKKFSAKEFFMIEVSLLANLSESFTLSHNLCDFSQPLVSWSRSMLFK